MYHITNGILNKDGKKLIALGQSYYPSFNECKFPVPPEGDRIGEMRKDLKMMAEMGFTHVRFAALGLAELDADGNMVIDTPFIDAMIWEAAKNDISVSVRLQGFTVNLRGFDNVEMIDMYGKKQSVRWSDFVRTTLNHPGILEDNRTHASALAEHYRQFPNVVAYQIYNEPHYPGGCVYDYHPETIKAYRKWLVERNVLTEQEAAHYEPPRGRRDQSPRMWALWRIFSRDSMTCFLDNASDAAKAAVPMPTYTCFTSDPIAMSNVIRGCDLFPNAKSMDIVGYTTYLHGMGTDYYPMCLQADTCQCAAELEGKESWCIELDSRTYIPIPVFNRNTYTILGSGCKGIVYYQWRGDCPVPGVPHPNSCGLLNYDGTKTQNYNNAANALAFIRSINDLLVGARRSHDGIGLLHSDYASFLCDATENTGHTAEKNSYLMEYSEIYRKLRDAGYSVTVTDGEHLDENPFGIRVLYVPHVKMLSPEEQAAVERFMAKGGVVYENSFTGHNTLCIGFQCYDKKEREYKERVYRLINSVYDVADLTGVHPKAASLDPNIGMQILQGDGYKLLVLTNISTTKKSINATVRCSFLIDKVRCFAMDGEKRCSVSGDLLTVENITDGCVLQVMEKNNN